MAYSIMHWQNYVAGCQKLSRKSENAVYSDHVLKFNFDSELGIVRGNVQASMKDRSYDVMVQLGDNQTVTHSLCTCPNGQDKCHHKASLLLFGYKNVSKTDVRRSWVKNPKSVPPKCTKTMEELFPPSERMENYRATSRPVTDDDKSFLYNQLGKLGRYTAAHWMLAPEPQPVSPGISLIEDLLSSKEFLSSDNQILWLRKELIINDAQISEVAEKTKGQRDNPLWSAVRKYRVTASLFGNILKAINRNRYPPSLFKAMSSTYDLSRKEAIMWGISHEDTAIEKYKSFGDAVVEPTGLWLHPNGALGASPDGLIRMPALFNFNWQEPQAVPISPELLEVKCPYVARNMKIAEAVSTVPNFCLEFKNSRTDEYKLKINHPYYDQVQGQMYIADKMACDFVVWTARDVAIVRIARDPAWQINIAKLTEFYFCEFIPHLIKQ